MLSFPPLSIANRVQDFFHNGQGFLAQHIKIDMLVQKALRDIEASITVPYWDWTYDQYLVRFRKFVLLIGLDWIPFPNVGMINM